MFISKKKIVFILLFIIPVIRTASAQELPVKAGKVLDLCYRFRFKSADSLLLIYFSELKKGEEVELQMLKANIYWWKIISGINDKTTKVNYYQTLAQAEKYFEIEADKGNSHLYKGISLYGYMARMDGLNKNYLKAFFRINDCLNYLEKSFGAESKYPFFYLSSGLYNYHIVVTARQYPVIAPYLYLYPKGDKNKGISYLQLAATNSNKYLSTEGHYFLMKIFLEEKKYTLALQHVNTLLERFPQNGIFLYYKFYINLQAGNPKEALINAEQLSNELKNNRETEVRQIAHFQTLIKEDIEKYNKQKQSKNGL